MKLPAVLLITGCILACCSCRKQAKMTSDGFVSVDINNTSWTGTVSVYDQGDRFDISVDKLDHNREPQQNLFLSHIRVNTGRQPIHRQSFIPGATDLFGAFYTLAGGDALCDIYRVDEGDSLNNYIEINDLSRDLTGTFQLRLYKEDSCPGSAWPDTLILRNGQFKIRL